MHDFKEKYGLTDEEDEKQKKFSEHLAVFGFETLEKFVRGMVKHRNDGTNSTDKQFDPLKELTEEIMDSVSYLYFLKQKQNGICSRPKIQPGDREEDSECTKDQGCECQGD